MREKKKSQIPSELTAWGFCHPYYYYQHISAARILCLQIVHIDLLVLSFLNKAGISPTDSDGLLLLHSYVKGRNLK